MVIYIEVTKGEQDNQLHVELGTYPHEVAYKAIDVYTAMEAAFNGIKADIDKGIADKGEEFVNNCTLMELVGHDNS